MSEFRDPAQKQAENKRMMLAMAVSMAVLMLWNSLFPPPVAEPQPPAEPAVAEQTQAAPSAPAAKPSSETTPAQAPAPAAEQAPPAVDFKEQTVTLEDHQRSVTLSSLGAQPTAVTLVDRAHGKIYREPGTEEDRPVVDLAKGRPDFAALSLEGLTPTSWSQTQATERSVTYRAQTPTLDLKRTWNLSEHGLEHQLEVTARQTTQGAAALSLSMADPLLGGSMFSGPPDLPRSLCHSGEELTAEFASDLKDEQPKLDKPYLFGVDRNFFAVVFTGGDAQGCSLSVRNGAPEGSGETLDVVVAQATKPFKLAAGQSMTWNNTLYLLPKSDDLLGSVDPKLRDTIDFGIFKFIAQPMLWLLTFYFSLLGNYGLAIILLTFTVKLLLWPITDMSFRSMARMKEIQPELTALREKYKADKQMLAQKQMEMFKERGVNPAGGCLPMLLQIPVWFALYSTLRVAVELYGSPFIPGWLDDLTLADPFYILPVVLGVVFFMQQKLQPQMSDNPQQQMIMKVMPVMMTVFMIALPSGLVIYILVNTILGIGHQYYAIKRDAQPAT